MKCRYSITLISEIYRTICVDGCGIIERFEKLMLFLPCALEWTVVRVVCQNGEAFLKVNFLEALLGINCGIEWMFRVN